MPAAESRRALLAAALLLPAGLAQAAPLSGFDAYSAWDQRLPSLLEFTSLTFGAGGALVLTAAEGGTTIRVLETLRIERLLNLAGSFSFVAGHVDVPSVIGPHAALGVFNTSLDDTLTIQAESMVIASQLGPDEPVGGDLGNEGFLGGTISPSPGGGELIVISGPVEPGPVEIIGGIISTAPTELTLGEVMEVRPVPLPAALPLLVGGIGLLAGRTRRRG